jgi:sugar transferase (PEP-CTERM system associated)
MLRFFRHYIPVTLFLLGLAETLILLVSIHLGTMLSVALPLLSDNPGGNGAPLWVKAMAYSVAMLCGLVAMGFYQREQRDAPVATLLRLLFGFGIGLVVMGLVSLVFPGLMVKPFVFGVALASSFLGIATCRLVCFATTDARFSRRVLVLGVGERALQIENLRRASDRVGITLIGYVDIGVGPQMVNSAAVIRPTGSLLELARRFAADEMVIAIDDRRKGLPVNEILDCKMEGIRILEEGTFLERQLGKIRLDALHPSQVIFSDGFTQAVLKKTEKRILDVAIASLLLLLSLPLFVLAALAIYLESGGPILYRQQRVGLRGKNFDIFKFRSMRVDAERNGPVWAEQGDSRTTRVGRVIRRFRVDELPQLLNVLKGDMSFVGPRPERPEFVADLARAIPYYELRHHVKPGITGWAQISYPYGASIKDAREKLQYDLYYLKNYSIFLDINILLQTAQVILLGKGVR